MTAEAQINKPRAGFEYLDLDRPCFTEEYMPYPGNPDETYVVKLGILRTEEQANNAATAKIIVEAVYRLIHKENEDGRCLAVRVTRDDLVNTMKRFYDQTFEGYTGYVPCDYQWPDEIIEKAKFDEERDEGEDPNWHNAVKCLEEEVA